MLKQRRVFYLVIASLFISTVMVSASGLRATRFRAKFKSDVKIEDQRPKGKATWKQHKKGRTRLKIRMQQIPGAGTTVDVTACGEFLGTLPVNAEKEVKLSLDTKNFDTVPTCDDTSTITVTGSSGLNMSGDFKGK